MASTASRCRFPWSHQDFLRLDDWTVECVHCHRTRREPRRAHRAGHYTKEEPRMALVSRVWKALAAGVSAGLASWAVAEQTGSVETGQLIAIILAALGVALTTYLAPKNVEA